MHSDSLIATHLRGLMIERSNSKENAVYLAHLLQASDEASIRFGFFGLLLDGSDEERVCCADLIADLAVQLPDMAAQLYDLFQTELTTGLFDMLEHSNECKNAALRAITNLCHAPHKSSFLDDVINSPGFEVRGGLIGLIKFHGDGSSFLSSSETMITLANLTSSSHFVAALGPEHADPMWGSMVWYMKYGNELERCSGALALVNISLRAGFNVPFRLESRRLHRKNATDGMVALISDNGTMVTKSYGLSAMGRLMRENPRAIPDTVNENMCTLQRSLVPLMRDGLAVEDRINAACLIALFTEHDPAFGMGLNIELALNSLVYCRSSCEADVDWAERARVALEGVRKTRTEIFGEEELC